MPSGKTKGRPKSLLNSRKEGYSLLARPNQTKQPAWKDPVVTTITLEREVIENAKKLFPGQISILCSMFLQEVCKKRPRIIFEMPFERSDEIEGENPFQKPSLLLQCHRRNGRVIARHKTVFAAHLRTGVAPPLIIRCANGLQKTAGKYQWRWDDQVVPWDQ